MLATIPWWNWKQSFHHAPAPSNLSSQSLFHAIIHRSVVRVKRRHIFRFDIWQVNVTLKQDWTFMGVKTTTCCPPIQTKDHWQWLAETTHCISSSFHFLGRGKSWWGGSLGKLGKGKKFKLIFSSVETASGQLVPVPGGCQGSLASSWRHVLAFLAWCCYLHIVIEFTISSFPGISVAGISNTRKTGIPFWEKNLRNHIFNFLREIELFPFSIF